MCAMKIKPENGLWFDTEECKILHEKCSFFFLSGKKKLSLIGYLKYLANQIAM